MKKVLMISYHFPPVAGGGVFRTLKYVKYLPNFGWQPIVLSVKKSKFAPLDSNLLDEVSDEIKIYRTNTLESKICMYGASQIGLNPKWYQIPDAYFGWFPFAVRKAMEIIRKEKPNVVYSTSLPVTSHLIAMILKKKTSLPWIADFRDPWTQSISIKYPTKIYRKIEENLEHKVTKLADKIILITDFHRMDLLKKYPNLPKEKCITIMNGYDPDDFKDVQVKKSKKFTITHIGSFYGRRSPIFFLEALQNAMKERESMKKDLEVLFIGKSSKEYTNIANRYELSSFVKEIGYISHKKAIQYMVDSTCLLLVVGIGKGDERVLTGKIFEYMASKTPIIATIPINGIAADLIKETNTGLVVNTNDVDNIKKAILHYYNNWKNDNLQIKSKLESIKKYSRIELTKRLAENFDKISEKVE